MNRISNRWSIVTVFALAFALSLILGSRLSLDEDITAMLPDSDPVIDDYRFVLTRFNMLDRLYIDISTETDTPEARETVVAVADSLYERLSQSDWFEDIHYRGSPEQFTALIETLSSRKPLLMSPEDMSLIADQLTRERIERKLEAARQKLIEPSGSFMLSQIRRDPLGLDEYVFKKLESIKPADGDGRVIEGRIWSADLRHLLMIASPGFPSMDTRRGARLVAMLNHAREKALQAAPAGTVRINFVGGHIAALDNAETIKEDVRRAVVAISVGIAACGILFFRRKTYIVLVFLPPAFGMACATAIFGIFNPNISGITVGCGVVLVGITVDYGVHILYRMDNSEPGELSPGACVRSMLLPLTMGACTTISAFLCLGFSSIPGQRQMGLFAALGVLGSALFSLFALPRIMPGSSKTGRGLAIPLASHCRAFLEWSERRGTLLAAIGLLVVAASAVGLFRLRFEGDVSKMNFLRPASRQAEEELYDTWGSFAGAIVAVRGPTIQKALQANDRLFKTLGTLAEEGGISSFSSISPILPSAKTQDNRWARWEAFWSDEKRAEIQEHVNSTAQELGFVPTAFQPFYESLSDRPSPLTLNDYEGTSFEKLIQAHIAEGGGECVVVNTFLPSAASALDGATSRIRKLHPDAIIMDRRHFVEHTNSLVIGQLGKLAVAACIAVVLCLLVFLYRIELVLTAFFPVCMSVLITLGTMGLAGISINLVNALFIVFVFGVGIDYSIFLLSSSLDVYRGRACQEATTCGSISVCAITTVFAFAALALAEHPMLFSIGITGLIGIVSSMVTAIVLVPALTRVLLAHEGRYGAPTLRTLGGTAWTIIYLIGHELIYLCFIRFFVWLRFRKDAEARRSFARSYIHKIAAGVLSHLPYRDSKSVLIDAEPEVFEPAAVIVSNHLSQSDIMMSLALPTEMVMIVKGWVWKAPIMGSMVRSAGYLLADGAGAESLLSKSSELLDRGVSVMIFPEGTRSPDGKMRRFHMGAFELAIRTKSDILPVMLSNTQACIPRHGFWVWDFQSVSRVLPRVTTKTFDYSLGARALARHVKEKMLAHEKEDWRLAQQGKPFWRNIRALYNYRGARVESYITWKLRLDPIYRRVDEIVPLEGFILDLGCGFGLMSNILARKSLHRRVKGVDFDKPKIEIANRTVPARLDTSFETQDIRQWEYPNADTVLLIDVLHYWSEETQKSIIEKVGACLPEGGTVVFRDALDESKWRHRLTAWSEVFSTTAGQNRRGETLCFLHRDFYLSTFKRAGLELFSEPPNLGRGSNAVLIFRKERQ